MSERTAGRELDAEICEKIFNLKRRDFISDSGTHYAAPGEEVYWRGQMFRPSKDIAAAWQVHRHICGEMLLSVRRTYLDALTNNISKRLDAHVAWPDLLIFIQPEDFCLAALAAVERKPK